MSKIQKFLLPTSMISLLNGYLTLDSYLRHEWIWFGLLCFCLGLLAACVMSIIIYYIVMKRFNSQL